MGAPAPNLGTNPFSSNAATPLVFAGRERELGSFRQWLAGIHNQPQHGCVVGRPGEGKTSFLQKAQSEATDADLIACRARLEARGSREQNIHSIVEKLLGEIDKTTKLKLRDDWRSGKSSTFQVPKQAEIRTDDLVEDLQSFLRQLEPFKKKPGCLICVDDGHFISPSALATIRNALHDVGSGYMLLMSLRNDSAGVGNIIEGQRMIQEFVTTSTDTGVARLFWDNFLALGPFDNQIEAEACIRKRLVGHPIQFKDDVVLDIGRVTGRQPSPMMILAKQVYFLAEAANPQITAAGDAVFKDAFVNTQKPLVDAATEFSAQETNTRKQVYRATLRHDKPFTALLIANEILGSSPAFIKVSDFAVDPVAIALDRLVTAGYCARLELDQYQWIEPLRTHALRVVVG